MSFLIMDCLLLKKCNAKQLQLLYLLTCSILFFLFSVMVDLRKRNGFTFFLLLLLLSVFFSFSFIYLKGG